MEYNNNPLSFGGRIGRKQFIANHFLSLAFAILISTLTGLTFVVVISLMLVALNKDAYSFGAGQIVGRFCLFLTIVTSAALVLNNQFKRARDAFGRELSWLNIAGLILPGIGQAMTIWLIFAPSKGVEEKQ